ncbi:hypothetical protein BU26DRAFT_526092 [Trematosphaeria pertusa]|uniref:F-box domain-containing protein n=1 Tax=Trematosphaeria pertusa TaxID=390896 RepID=A0A6A6HS96_9PLEO|nr:uncharacterized protein BU26DRAFT_526092 [Trematosphaeria pertusa]KAF2240300.1 hypothetical protein BU26DRAFT_526092 [Trematosphaeria pertusa]
MLQFASEAPSEVKHLSRFDRLQHFTIPCPGEISDIVDLKVPRNDLLLFFHLPNVVSLDLDTVLSFDNYSALPSCAPAWRQLKTLRLCHSFVSADTVELLLRHAPQLKTLVYDCHLPASAGCLDLGKLRQGLEHVCSTLSSLRVAYEILGDELNPDDLETVVTGSIGSLRNFASLAELEISLIALYGQSPPSSVPSLAQLLPFNLQHLTIADDLWDHPVFEPWLGESTMDLLKAFFQDDWMTATPLLKKFVFDMEERRWASEDYWTEDEPLDELEQLCTNQGLVCIILG